MTMQIAHVGLRNIRSYRSADLSLGPGTTLLSGDIGSGKTSLLYAIEMALFGFAEVDPAYLVRHGAKTAEVALILTDGKRRWELRRRFVRRARKGKDTFEPTENSLSEDGQRRTYSATELRRRTIELLGFPDNPNPRAHSDVFRWAVYLAQERMRDVLDPDVDARMETVRKALGVEQYRLAGENARGLARSLRDRAAGLAEQGARHRGVEDEATQWRRAESSARAQLTALDTREQSLREELAHARATLDGIELQRRELELARESIAHQERLGEELSRSIEQDRSAQQSARERLAQLEAQRTLESPKVHSGSQAPKTLEPLRAQREKVLHELSDLEGLRGQASGVDDQLAQWQDRNREATARHQATLEQRSEVRAELTRAGAIEPILEPRVTDRRTQTELAKERNRLEEARRTVDRRLAAASVELKELAELVHEGVCPRCHRPIEAAEFESHRQEQEALVAGLQHELDQASERVQAADARSVARLEYDRTYDHWEQLELRRGDLRQRDATLEATAASEEVLMSRLASEHVALEGRRRALAGPLEAVERVRGELAAVERELVEVEERARAAAVRAERLAALERQIPEVQTEIELRRKAEEERTARREEVLRQIQAASQRLETSPNVEELWKAAQHHLDELGRYLEDVLREASGPRGKLGEAAARLDDIDRRLREREALNRQATQLTALSEWIDADFRNAMLDLERRRLEQGRFQFERRFALYFAALVEDPALAARVDDTFAPWVDIAGQATPAEALSGGERTALALAYRLALGRTVRDAGRLALETLILDEPTEGFSQEQTLRMGDLLAELGLPQVILVSHERQLEGIADRVVRVRKMDGVSVIEQAEQTIEAAPTDGISVDELPAKPKLPTRRRKIRRLTDLEAAEPGDGSAHAK